LHRKRRKARKLRDRYGAIVTLLERDDLERLLGRAKAQLSSRSDNSRAVR
jgi:hypothetical protein